MTKRLNIKKNLKEMSQVSVVGILFQNHHGIRRDNIPIIKLAKIIIGIILIKLAKILVGVICKVFHQMASFLRRLKYLIQNNLLDMQRTLNQLLKDAVERKPRRLSFDTTYSHDIMYDWLQTMGCVKVRVLRCLF